MVSICLNLERSWKCYTSVLILERSYDNVEEKGGAGWNDVTSAPVTVGQAGRYHCAKHKTILSLQSPNQQVWPPKAKTCHKTLVLIFAIVAAQRLCTVCSVYIYSNRNNIMARVVMYVNLGSSTEEIRQMDMYKMRQGVE